MIPYRTSYYERTWGFCLSHRQLLELQPGDYEVVIDSTLEPGHLTYAELADRGRGRRARSWSRPTSATPRSPTTTSRGSPSRRCSRRSCWSAGCGTPTASSSRPARSARSPGCIENRDGLDRIEHGLTLSCIGDGGNLTYKRSRRGDAEVDRAMETVLRDSGAPHRVLPWEPWGGDERQFCSPGFDLPVGTLMRTPHGEFDGYHTSADGLERIRPESLAEAVDTCLDARRRARDQPPLHRT